MSWIVKEESELPGKAREGSAESTEVTKHVLSAFSFRKVWWLQNRKYMREGWDMRPEKRAAALSQGKASVSGQECVFITYWWKTILVPLMHQK